MTTLPAAVLMVGVESALLIWAAASNGAASIRGRIIAVNMIMVSLFGQCLIEIGDAATNITNICYAAAVSGQAVVLARHGQDAARATVIMVGATLATLFALTYCLTLFPTVDGNAASMVAMRQLLKLTPDILAASFAAFFLSQMVMIRAWRRIGDHSGIVWRILLASLCCQAVDTPTFFLIAFLNHLPLLQIFDMISVGFLIKAALSVAFLPAILVSLTLLRARVSAHG